MTGRPAFCAWRCVALLTLVMWLGAGSPSAAQPVYGSGQATCASWLEARRTGPEWFQSAQWVLGWISAASHFGRRLHRLETHQLVAWLDEYCARNPGRRMRHAAVELVDKLSTGVADSPEQGSGNSIVRQIQIALTEGGYDPGPVDGILGPRTRGAIERFQLDRGLFVDGKPTRELLERIRDSAYFKYR